MGFPCRVNMKRFEYKVCVYNFAWGEQVNMDELNRYGGKGWEAVGVLDNERILLKREIQ